MKIIVLSIVVFIATILIISAITNDAFAQVEKSPLTIEFILDPELLKFFMLENVNRNLQDTVEQASLIFNYQIGRRLEIEKITIKPIPPSALTDSYLKYDDLLNWLKNLPKQSDFLIFVSGKFLKDKNGNLKSGAAFKSTPDDKRRESTILYFSDSKLLKLILLHEIGHNCGADHATEKSIMNSTATSDLKFDSMNTTIIKEYCE